MRETDLKRARCLDSILEFCLDYLGAAALIALGLAGCWFINELYSL